MAGSAVRSKQREQDTSAAGSPITPAANKTRQTCAASPTTTSRSWWPGQMPALLFHCRALRAARQDSKHTASCHPLEVGPPMLRLRPESLTPFLANTSAVDNVAKRVLRLSSTHPKSTLKTRVVSGTSVCVRFRVQRVAWSWCAWW